MAKIRLEPFTEAAIPAVQAFNERMRAGGSEFVFPDHPYADFLPKLPGRKSYQDMYLLLEGDDVRGGFILRWQDFAVNGEMHRIAHYKLPLSEGIVNPSYARLGLQIVRYALRIEPKIFALGMGSRERALPKMLEAMKWGMYDVPFSFSVGHGGAFVRNIKPLRTTEAREQLFDVAAALGVADIGIAAVHFGQRLRRRGLAALDRGPRPAVDDLTTPFDDWADDLWQRAMSHYTLCGVRDAEMLNLLYPAEDLRFIRLRIQRRGQVLGWAVCLDTQMHRHKQFGDMRVATIVDGLALPDHVRTVVDSATRHLLARGADMVVSNQGSAAWHSALLDCGFLDGPSNYIFAASPKLRQLLEPFDASSAGFHINRGDGDGPINL